MPSTSVAVVSENSVRFIRAGLMSHFTITDDLVYPCRS